MSAQTLARTQRIAALLAAPLFVLAGLTSCTPERKGITGLSVDAAGRPLALLAWCANRPPDVVLLFPYNNSASPAPSGVATPSASRPFRPLREYAVLGNATSPASVPLVDFPPESANDPDAAFRMYGVADNNSFTTHSVTFRLNELAGLDPESVLITDIDNGEVQTSISLDEFARLGRHEC